MREVVGFREQLGAVSARLPDGSELRSAGLRTFAVVAPVYERHEDGSLVNTAEGTLLAPDHEVGFYRNAEGVTVAPGWRVWVGWDNFQRVLLNEGIRQPMLTIFLWTVSFALLSVILSFALGMLLASILQWPHLKGKALYRILLILPYAVPAFISMLVFRGLFNQNFGEINFILRSLFGIAPEWFTNGALTRTMVVIVNVWLGYPYMMLLSMGYLQSVPQDHYKAAALEGSGPLRSFFSITLPQILPPFVPLLISSFAFNFNNVVLILLLTRGAPDIPGTLIPAGQTDILGSFTFRMSFNDAGQSFGIAGAISTMIFIIVGLMAYANFYALRRAAEARGRG
jgi:maltose/maltodextrin transport system permease protein